MDIVEELFIYNSTLTIDAANEIITLRNQLKQADIDMEEFKILQNQLAECQKDAERYRWLMNDCDGNKQDDLFQWMAGNVFSRSYIDKAIDQAMSEKGE